MVQRLGWCGFDGRAFLTNEEHQTYCRRLPVRYPRKNLRVTGVCAICGKRATADNRLQAAHRVPFGRGIIQFWLTPEWLDGPKNLVWAHQKVCNKKAEILTKRIAKYLQSKCQVKLPKHVLQEPRENAALIKVAHYRYHLRAPYEKNYGLLAFTGSGHDRASRAKSAW